MMALCNGRNMNKFQCRRLSWSQGLGEIPLAHLNVIQVSLDVLEDLVQADAADYARALATLPTPSSFIVKALPAVYVTRPLPETRRIEDIYWLVQVAIESMPNSEVQAYHLWPKLKSVIFAKRKAPKPC